ncbi:MAG: response regulator [Kofleriaceae bacterium]
MPGRTKLLLVELVGPARDALAALLVDEGFDVRVADCADAVATARELEPAVAIVDLVSCSAVVTQLRALPRGPQVIAMTEYGRIAPALAALRAGALDYLIKPVRGDELFVVVGKAIEHDTLARELDRLRAQLSLSTH